MDEQKEKELEGYWIGLRVLKRLSERGTRLTSTEVAELLGARSVKGIGQVLSRTRSMPWAVRPMVSGPGLDARFRFAVSFQLVLEV